MNQEIENQKQKSSSFRSDHMANERTFLAWIRTCIGIMAFGFVLEKFGVFMHRLTMAFGNEHLASTFEDSPAEEYSSWFGVCIVALSILLSILAFIKYKRVEKEIDRNLYHSSFLIDVMLILTVLSIGVFLSYYLEINL